MRSVGFVIIVVAASLGCTREAKQAVAPQHVCTLDIDTTDLATCQRECDAGDENSCLNLGIVSEMRGNPTLGQQTLLDSCGRGFHIACGHAARIALKGTGTQPPDPATAASLYSKACESGDGQSCYELGNLVSAGSGVAPDAHEAIRLYEQACNAHVVKACEALDGARPAVDHEPKPAVLDSME